MLCELQLCARRLQENIYFLDVKLTTLIPVLTSQTSPCLLSSPSMTMDLVLVLFVVRIISINIHFASNILEERIRDTWASVILVKEIVRKVYNYFHFKRRFLAFNLKFLISTWVFHCSLLLKQRFESPGNRFEILSWTLVLICNGEGGGYSYFQN